MNRFDKIRKAIAVQFADNAHHIDYAFERGYKDMQAHVQEEFERNEEAIGYSFVWDKMYRLPTEAEQTAYYYGARCASRVEYLLAVLDEEAVNNQLEDIVLQEHHNMMYTPHLKSISSIVEKDKELKQKRKNYSPRKARPWLDQQHHPAVIYYHQLMSLQKL